MSDPAISVVLPTFNHLGFLPDAVEDILRQTRGDWELIVVNDGSTDGSAAWLDAQRHPRLRVIHQENRGAAEAINTGIRAARGHYVTWVSADNRCTPYFLEALAAPLDLHPECVLSYSPFFGIDARGTVHSLKHNNLLLLRELVSNAPRGNAGFLYRRAVHEAVGDYESWVCDTLMWSRILDGRRSVFVLEPTYYYRFHDDRATVRHAQAIEEERHRIMAEFLQRHGPDVDGEMLVRLYPALSQLPAQVGEAATDFSLRLFANGFPEQAVRLQLRLLSTCAPEGLLRPLQALLSCAAPQWDELDAPARMALDANRRLSPEQRQHALGMARAAAAAAQAGLGLAPPVLEPAHPLLTREQPLLFSFCAWKAGMAGGALPGF